MSESVDVYGPFRSPCSCLVTPDLGVEAERRGRGLEFVTEVSALIFGGTDGRDQGDLLKDTAARAGLDLAELDAAIENGDHLEEIERDQQALEAARHRGVPTMVVRDEPFFGQDRIDTLRWRLDQYGLKRARVSRRSARRSRCRERARRRGCSATTR